MNYQQKFINLRKLQIPFTNLRAFYTLIVVTLSRSIYIPFLALIINSRYLVIFIENLLLPISRYRPTASNLYIIYLTLALYSILLLLKYINTLSIQAEYYLSKKSYNTQLIYYQKVLGVLARLKGVTIYLQSLNYVQKAIFYLLPLAIQILQKA